MSDSSKTPDSSILSHKMDMQISKPNISKIVVIVGSTGVGKSTLINMLYNDNVSKDCCKGPCRVDNTADSVTKKADWCINVDEGIMYGDTIGFGDPKMEEVEVALSLKSFLTISQGGVHCIILVLRFGRMSKEERLNLQSLDNIFDKRWPNNCIVVATHYDEQMDEISQVKAKENWIGDDEDLKVFITKIGGIEKIILTDNTLGRNADSEEYINIRLQCLNKLKKFRDLCISIINPTPTTFIDKLKLLLEQWFSFYRVKNAVNRMQSIVRYLKEASAPVVCGQCPICLEVIAWKDMGMTKCQHKYHWQCVNKAIPYGAPCPLCRCPVYIIYINWY